MKNHKNARTKEIGLANGFDERRICLEVRPLNTYNNMEKYELQVRGLMKEFQMTGFCRNIAASCTDMSHCSCVNNTQRPR